MAIHLRNPVGKGGAVEHTGAVVNSVFDVYEDVLYVLEGGAGVAGAPFPRPHSYHALDPLGAILEGWNALSEGLFFIERFVLGSPPTSPSEFALWLLRGIKEGIGGLDGMLCTAFRVAGVAERVFGTLPAEVAAAFVCLEGVSTGFYLILFGLKSLFNGVTLFKLSARRREMLSQERGADAAFQKRLASLDREWWNTAAYLALKVAGFALFAIGLAITEGAGLIALCIASLLVSAAWMALDMPQWLQALRSKEWGLWDHILIAAALVLVLLTLALLPLLSLSAVELLYVMGSTALLFVLLLWTLSASPKLEKFSSIPKQLQKLAFSRAKAPGLAYRKWVHI